MQLLHFYKLFVCLSMTLAKQDELKLPLCPKYLEYFPQELPMHCRLPRNADSESFGLPPDAPFPFFNRTEKQPPPVPIPIPRFPALPDLPRLPNMPGSSQNMPDMPIPANMHGPGMPDMSFSLPRMPGMPVPPPGMPGMVGMPGGPAMAKRLPMPMQMPMPMPGSQAHKLPVIVMPFYSPDLSSYKKKPHHSKHPSKKPHKKRPRYHVSSETDTSDDSDDNSDVNDSGDKGWWKAPKKHRGSKKYGISRRFYKHHIKKKKRNGELLTPILQYVTKDGYVIFEKKITKNEASNWLGPKEGAKAKEEINFQKGLETELQEATVEPDEEDKTQTDAPKGKETKANSVEVKEMNEMDETEESQTEYPPRRFKPSRTGSLLANSPQA